MQRYLCLWCCLYILIISCSSAYKGTGIQTIAFPNLTTPDYNHLAFWAAHPAKNDPADSIPNSITQTAPDTSADVFFIHPTTFTSSSDTGWNASLSNDTLNRKTDNSTILYQASAFNAYPVFAPRYRQAHLRAYYSNDTSRARQAFDLAYQDIKAAFERFLLLSNKPIVLASHSQGSTHAIRLLNEYFQEGPLRDRLVVAYVIGMNITSIGTLTSCIDSISTGCVCGWRTFREGYLPSYISKETGPVIITNPVTWKTNEQPASRMLNKGALIRDFDKIYKYAADAKIEGRVLWVSQLRFPGSILIRQKNLHIGDINLFYMNIRENVKTRVNAFYNK